MGHRKLKKFKENESFRCLLQPDTNDLIERHEDAGITIKPHSIKGRWNKQVFDKERPIILELGCGRGEYTIDLAQRNPNFNYIGVDIKGARLWQGAKYATEHSLGNVAFLRTRIEFIEAFFAKDEIAQIWLTFSDPQLKNERKRLTSPLFLERYKSFLKSYGIIHLKTDSLFLHTYTAELIRANSLDLLASTDNLYNENKLALYESPIASLCGRDSVDALFDVQTYYEKMFLEQNLNITYLAFRLSNRKFVSPDWDEDYWRDKEGNRRTFNHRPNED